MYLFDDVYIPKLKVFFAKKREREKEKERGWDGGREGERGWEAGEEREGGRERGTRMFGAGSSYMITWKVLISSG